MARQPFVVDDCRDDVARPFRAVLEVEIDEAGPRAVDRGRLGERRRSTGFGLLGHAPHLELVLRHPAEHLAQPRQDRRQPFVAEGDRLFLARIGIGEDLARQHVDRLAALADRALGIALLAQDRVHLRLQFLALRDAEFVHLLWGQLGGRVVAQAHPVEFGTLRQVPDPGPRGRLRPNRLHRRQLRIERGQHLRVVDRGRLPPPIVAQPLGGGAGRDRLDHARVRGRLAQRLHLRDRQIQDKVGRDHALGGIGLEAIGVADQLVAERRQPREIRLRIGAGLDRMLGVEKVRSRLIRPRLLADHIGRRAIAGAAEVEPRDIGRTAPLIEDHVVIDAIGGRELRRIECLQPLQLARILRLRRLAPCGATIAELPAQCRERPLVQAKLGRALGPQLQPFAEEIIEQLGQGRVAAGGGSGALREGRECGDGSGGGTGQEQLATVEAGRSHGEVLRETKKGPPRKASPRSNYNG